MDTQQILSSLLFLDLEISELEGLLVFAEDETETIKEIQKLKTKREKEYTKILKAIGNIDNSLYRTVLIMRYIKKMSVLQIANKLHYSHEYMYAILKKAEQAIKFD